MSEKALDEFGIRKALLGELFSHKGWSIFEEELNEIVIGLVSQIEGMQKEVVKPIELTKLNGLICERNAFEKMKLVVEALREDLTDNSPS